MEITEQAIRERAFARISKIFGVPVDQLRYDSKFGEDLHPSFVSDFRYNELDQIFHDIEDVTDRKTVKEMRAGLRTIYTVGDYCDHMVYCYKTMPIDVSVLLGFMKKPPTPWMHLVVLILFMMPPVLMVLYLLFHFFRNILNQLNNLL